MSCFINLFNKKKFECAICLDNDNHNIRKRKLNCGHKYHFSCIETWLKNNKTCPLCKKETLPLKEQLEKDLKYLPDRYKILCRLYY
tara:strand:- start:188 stop:445 length:258 start_codon:yes stop_codon:yes gene_type:complete